jgi:hypothetical protein
MEGNFENGQWITKRRCIQKINAFNFNVEISNSRVLSAQTK